jgi:colicin import membrane protein
VLVVRLPKFLNEDIIKVGQELEEQGCKVTGFALRQKVGGGSISRIKKSGIFT